MKTIGIDARLYFQTGVGVYLRNFLHYLEQITPPDYQYIIYVLGKDSKQITFHSKQFIKREVNSHWHSLSEQTKFYSVLKSDNLDLMHFTYFSYPVLYKRKFISTIHDVTPLVHKTGKASTLFPLLYELKHQSLKYVLKQQMKNSSVIITPTQTVKKELISIYGNKYADKINPIYEGLNYEMDGVIENNQLTKKFTKPFLLYVGNFYPHKNVEKLIAAFKNLPEIVDLVLVGPDNFFSGKIEQQIHSEGIKNIRFYHTGSIKDHVFFYKNALALVNPSISEGFGLPLIEAAHFNRPIIASDLPVFHELFGNNYLSFDPHSEKDIQDKLELFIRKKPTFDYSEIMKKYSFKKMTKEIVEIYKEQLG